MIPEDIEKEALNETFEPERNMLSEVRNPLSKTVKQPKDSEKRHKFFGKHLSSESYSYRKGTKPASKQDEEEKKSPLAQSNFSTDSSKHRLAEPSKSPLPKE